MRIADAVKRLSEGEPLADIPMQVKKDVLNTPMNAALISLLMWFIAGMVFGLTSSRFETSALGIGNFFLVLEGVFGVGGVLVSALVFFGCDYLWRPVVGLFFANGGMHEVRAVRFSVLGRLLTAFLLVTLWPMSLLVALSMQRAQQIMTADDPQAVLSNMFTMELFLLGASLLISVGMALFSTRSVTEPLHRLEEAMERVSKSDLNAELTITSNDELGLVSEGFNRMVAGLRMGERVRTLLNLYVTPEVARQAVDHGVSLGGSLVECSVLFSDIRNFTGLTEQLQPAELIMLLNRYMTEMVAVIVENGGMVNKFGGDLLLAVFGTPLNPAEDHAARAVRSARGMMHALEDFNHAQRKAGQVELRMGIGIASGPAVAGNVGGQERIEYTVIGDTVNLAARLQDKTKELGHAVLMHQATYEQARRFMPLEAEEMEPVMVRGKQEPVEVVAL